MSYDRIQAHGYKQICDKCECDAGGAQCIPVLEDSIKRDSYNYEYAYAPSCTMAYGHLCQYYWKTYIKPRLK